MTWFIKKEIKQNTCKVKSKGDYIMGSDQEHMLNEKVYHITSCMPCHCVRCTALFSYPAYRKIICLQNKLSIFSYKLSFSIQTFCWHMMLTTVQD